MQADLAAYVPRLLLEWDLGGEAAKHRAIEGTLVFADVSGFTRLSERLARAGGKLGAEQMTDVINGLFGDLLAVAAGRGGEMLKYGGDAVLLFFRGEDHAPRGAAACVEMQRRLAEIGRVETGAGAVRLRMSVGAHSGTFDFFVVGDSHRELVVAGPAATVTTEMEAAADAGEVLVSPATAAALPPVALGPEKAGGHIVRRAPKAARFEPVPRKHHAGAAQFIPAGLRDHLTAGSVHPEHRLVAQAFVHVKGLDAPLLPGGAGAAAAADALERTLQGIQRVCDDYGVTFLSTDISADGTKVIVVAGAPASVDAAEACLVRAMRAVLDAALPLPLRIGVHRGHVFAGEVGPPFRRTYTTIGDVTNTAARVMGRAAPGELLALADVVDHLAGAFTVEQLEPFVAKGKTEPLTPFRVGEARRSSSPEVPASAVAPALVGRTEPVATLRAAVGDLRAGKGAAIVLLGPVGIGKTRLVEELRSALAPDHRTFVLKCEPYERTTPFFPFRHLLATVLGLGASTNERSRALEARIGSLAPALGPWVPLIADVLDVDAAETPETLALEPRFRRQRTYTVVEDLLKRVLPRPAIVVLEDVHWMDAPSRELTARLAAAAPADGRIVLCTTRDDDAPVASGAETIELGPLDEQASLALVRGASPRPLAPHRELSIVARSGGNPLFITELLQAPTEEVPDSLEAVVAAQIDALPAGARALLRCAAVLGSAFEAELLAELVDDGRTESPPALSRRLGSLVVHEDGSRLRFRHQLVRDVAYEGLPFRERRSLHRRAGEVIERRLAGEEIADRAGILALHFSASQDHARTWRYARAAAERAWAKAASVEAAQLLERAVEAAKHLTDVPLDEQARVLELLADVSSLVGDFDRASRAYRQARALRREHAAEFAKLCRKQARVADRQGRRDAAINWLRRGLRVVAEPQTAEELSERAELRVVAAWMRRDGGRPRAAIRWARLALEDADRSGNRRAVAAAYMVLDGAATALGQPTDPEHAQRALAIFEDEGLLLDSAVLLNNLGAHAYFEGRWDEALAMYRRSVEGNERAGSVIEAASGIYNIAEILLDQGRIEEAGAELQRAERLFASVAYAPGQVFVGAFRGRILARQGRHSDAIDALRSARAAFHRFGLAGYVLETDAWTAECLLHLGDPTGAAAIVEDALRVVEETGNTAIAPRLRRLSAYALLATSRFEDAWAALDESLAIAQRRNAPFEVALTLEAFAVAAELTGRAWGTERQREQRELLARLGVSATAPPPVTSGGGASVPASAGRG